MKSRSPQNDEWTQRQVGEWERVWRSRTGLGLEIGSHSWGGPTRTETDSCAKEVSGVELSLESWALQGIWWNEVGTGKISAHWPRVASPKQQKFLLMLIPHICIRSFILLKTLLWSLFHSGYQNSSEWHGKQLCFCFIDENRKGLKS